MAEQERSRLIERTRAGLQRARREGKRLGRPRREVDRAEVERRRAEGQSWREIAVALRCPRRTLERAVAQKG